MHKYTVYSVLLFLLALIIGGNIIIAFACSGLGFYFARKIPAPLISKLLMVLNAATFIFALYTAYLAFI